VVVGYQLNASTNSTALVGLTLTCAALNVTGSGRNSTVAVGSAAPLGPIGDSADTAPKAITTCPAGYVARGVTMRAANRIDSVGLSCGKLTLTYPAGSPCVAHEECQSTVCSGTCQSLPVIAEEDWCHEEVFGMRRYMLCALPMENKGAFFRCQYMAPRGHIATVHSKLDNGWLVGSMKRYKTDVFWLGANFADPYWTWGDDSSPLAVAGSLEPLDFWLDAEADWSGCLVSEQGLWQGFDCFAKAAFACECPIDRP
jgi:hypothetical protein